MRFTDQEISALKTHYGESDAEFDPDLEADLRDDGPEDTETLDVRRRYRQLLKLWAGRKSPGRGHWDAHTSHCCQTHGCKYGSEDCTVVTGAATQSDLCESCEQDLHELRHAEPEAEAYARSVAHMDLEKGNFFLVDGEKLFLEKPKATADCPVLVRLKAQHADLVWAIRTAYLAGVTR